MSNVAPSPVDEAIARLRAALLTDEPGSLKVVDALQEALTRMDCERYVCIYYNVRMKTHLEFNTIPTELHPRLKRSGSLCFEKVQSDENHDCNIHRDKQCGARNCKPSEKQFFEGLTEIKIKPFKDRWGKRWEIGSPVPFYLTYEVFMHDEFNPWATNPTNEYEGSAGNTGLFQALNGFERDSFYQANRIFRGTDRWFEQPGSTEGFSLRKINERNGLTTSFYGKYLIEPSDEEESRAHAAVLFAYRTVEHEESPTADEADKAARLLGVLSEVCWPTLNREIGRDMYTMNQAEARLKERERSAKMLELLQRPLDAITDAFARLQSEAQEMQAILNDPQEGLFRSYKLLAPCFEDDRPIQISPYLTVTTAHDFQDITPDDAKSLYCLILCIIFGITESLQIAQTKEALWEIARTGLRLKRQAAGQAFAEVIAMIAMVCGWKSGSFLEDSIIDAKPEELQHYLLALKRVVFTPYKAYQGEWFNAPVQLIAESRLSANSPHLRQKSDTEHSLRIDTERKLKMDPASTPFPQHAILSFIDMVVKNMLRRREPASLLPSISYSLECQEEDCAFCRGSSLKCLRAYRFEFDKGSFFEENDANYNNLTQCIRSTIRWGSGRSNVGNFLGIFQRLLSHGLGVVAVDVAQAGDWVQLEVPAASEAQPTWVLLCLGRVKSGAAGHEADACERFFAIRQVPLGQEESSRTALEIVWSSFYSHIVQTDNPMTASLTVRDTPVSQESVQASVGATRDESVSNEIVDGDDETWEWETLDQEYDQLAKIAKGAGVLVYDHRGTSWYDKLRESDKFLEVHAVQLRSHESRSDTLRRELKTAGRWILVLHVAKSDVANWEAALAGEYSNLLGAIIVSTDGDVVNKGFTMTSPSGVRRILFSEGPSAVLDNGLLTALRPILLPEASSE